MRKREKWSRARHARAARRAKHLMAALASLVTASSAAAANITATFDGFGSWSDPSAWNPHSVPNASNIDVIIKSSALIDGNYSVGSVSIPHGTTGNGELNTAGGGLYIYGDLTDQSLLSLRRNGAAYDGFITFSAAGDQRLSGTGTVQFGSTSGIYKSGSGVLTIEPTLKFR